MNALYFSALSKYSRIFKPWYHTSRLFPLLVAKFSITLFANFLMFLVTWLRWCPQKISPLLACRWLTTKDFPESKASFCWQETSGSGFLPWVGLGCLYLHVAFCLYSSWSTKFHHSYITSSYLAAETLLPNKVIFGDTGASSKPLGYELKYIHSSCCSVPKSTFLSLPVWPRWNALFALIWGYYCIFICQVRHLLTARRNLWILSLVKPRSPVAHGWPHGDTDGLFIRQGKQIQGHLQKPR